MAGEEVAQLYVNRALAGFQRIPLRPRQKKTVEFAMPAGTGALNIAVGGLTAAVK
jgi:hypothetical protein